jgi:glycosyltransferase involved in cell wall biosynthesis
MSLVTVIIPSIGRATIERSLNSLLNMNNPNWKALVGFDCVSDDIINNLNLPVDSRIIYHRLLEKKGGGNNYGGGVRNFLIDEAKTQWVCFLDDDDTFRPQYLDCFLEETKNIEMDCIVFRMSYHEEDIHVLPPLNSTNPEPAQVGISFAVKKSFLDNNSLRFRNGEMEDFDLVHRIHAISKIKFSNFIVYNVKF